MSLLLLPLPPPHKSDDCQRWPSLAGSVSTVSGSSVDIEYKGMCVVSGLGKPNYINLDFLAASSNSYSSYIDFYPC